MRTRSRESFTTITTEGSILPPDLLARVVERDKDLDGLDPSSYHLAGETLNEAISRSWNVLQGVWAAFGDRRGALPEGQPETGMTRERWLLPLFRELGYGQLLSARAAEIEGKSYPISHAWHHAPIHLVGFRTGLDKRTPGVAGAARISPHGLVQEFLNRSDDRLWGFLSDGLRLRILRDNASLTRQAYVEFDLEAMMDGEVYPDFVLLWLLCHQSRVQAERPEECYLEKWSHAASEQGTRALEGLRNGVEQAIAALGSGFLSHRVNDGLRGRLRSGKLDAQDYYRQLLRLVYRLLFFFVAEDRGLLLVPEADDAAKDRYTRFYSTRKLRDVAEKRVGARHSDLYRALSLVMQKLGDEDGYPELGLPALGGFLFSQEAMPDLAGAEISNRDLLDAVRALSLVDYDSSRRPVDYKNLGAEELGSVYESLLELQPELDSSSGTFTLRAVTGNERKTTGSYYTPHSLVTSLLDTALDPVLDEAARKPNPEKAILDIKVCDPAVGSGHFLIAAAHRMAKRLASVRTGDDEPSPEATREALRDVIGSCLYGVDVNPMAAELCKVNLWMEALVPGRPLSFLDHHVQVGNSLLGATPELIADGIPNEAFKFIEGDDKRLSSAYKKRNLNERAAWKSGQFAFSLRTLDKNWKAIERRYEEVEEVEESSVAAVREKATRYAALQDSEEMSHARHLADAWCAVFVWPKREEATEPITQELFADLTRDAYALSSEKEKEIEQIAEHAKFFHWHLAFPKVFNEKERGGFDVVLGNPPWDRIKVQEREYFRGRGVEIARETNSGSGSVTLAQLKKDDPELYAGYVEQQTVARRIKLFLSSSGKFQYCGVGDINTYALFPELALQILRPSGLAAMVTQTQLVTEKTYSAFLRYLLDTEKLSSCYAFENERGLFPGAHHSLRFVLLTMGRTNKEFSCATALWHTEWLNEEERVYILDRNDVRRFNPSTNSIPQFRTTADANIAKKIYANYEPLKCSTELRSGVTASRVMHDKDDADVITWDRGLAEGEGRLPLLESKLFEQYNHRFATYESVPRNDIERGYPRPFTSQELSDPECRIVPRKWVAEHDTPVRFQHYKRGWLLHVRKITNNIMVRTVVSSITPRFPNNGSAAWIRNDRFTVGDYLFLNGILNSLTLDYLARQKVAGINLNSYHLFQFPIPAFLSEASSPWHSFICSRVFELTYTASDLSSLALECGYLDTYGDPLPPFSWSPDRRHILRCEIDAAVARLYNLSKEELHWILDATYPGETFRVLRQQEISQFGEYRTKRVILETHEQMTHAAETGQPYQTLLDPPPAELDLPTSEPAPATVTPLRPRTRPESKRPTEARVADERATYEVQPSAHPKPEPEAKANDARPDPTEEAPSATSSPQHQASEEPQDALFERPAPQTVSLEDAALALHACVPDGEKIDRHTLLLDAARELGLTKLTRKVRRALNQALNAEHNAGRLRTDWERVWKPRRR